MEVNGGAEIPLQLVEDPTPEQVAGPGEGHDSVGKPTLEQFVEDCSAWKGLTLEKFVKDCLLWEGPHAGAGEECEESSPLRRKEWQKQRVMN